MPQKISILQNGAFLSPFPLNSYVFFGLLNFYIFFSEINSFLPPNKYERQDRKSTHFFTSLNTNRTIFGKIR